MMAELHGKSRREDLLTSYVFGIIASYGILPAFRAWFATAEPIRMGDPPLKLGEGLSHIAFWPSFGKYGIPDATVIVDGGARPALIGVEVKDEAGLGPGQLCRYAEALASRSRLRLDTWRVRPALSTFRLQDDRERSALLYITGGLGVPLADVAGCRDAPIPVYWLSWRGLFRCLKDQQPLPCAHCQTQIDDLCAILRRRKLFAFEGFGNLKPWSGNAVFYH